VFLNGMLKLMIIVVYTYIFAIGASMGSFMLAMVDRMHAKEDWVRGRSKCDFCNKKLRSLDLIPILSWVFSRGSCRYCHAKLSPTYPLVEILTGGLFVLSVYFFPVTIDSLATILLFVLWLAGLSVMVALLIFDLRWMLLPTRLVYIAALFGFLYRILYIVIKEQDFLGAITSTVAGIILVCGFFYVLHTVSNGEWIGDGDIRFGLVMGLYLPGPLHVWFAVFIASLLGLIVSVPSLISSGKKAMRLKIPFGPLLIAGLVLTFFFTDQAGTIYKSLMY
jgi:leader peptidase (prepilin peptidase)/N-methyltransferase